MARRSREREEFLSDIIICAIEGGIGYWSQTSFYQYVDSEGNVSVVVGEGIGRRGTYAVIHEDDGEGGYSSRRIEIDIDTIARGIQILNRGGGNLNTTTLGNILAANARNDAGEIDSDAADAIVQHAVFGRLVYG